VLTAAHCAKRVKLRKILVIAGSAWATGPRAGTPIPVQGVRIHPSYNGQLDRRDVAVIMLAWPTPAPVATLPTSPEAAAATRPGVPVWSAGWGARRPWGDRLSKRITSTREQVLPNEHCRDYFKKSGYEASSMLCVLGSRSPRLQEPLASTSCLGDSGGPLVARTPGGPRLIGVVSAGPFPCGVGPSIYARVPAALDFIREAAGLEAPQQVPREPASAQGQGQANCYRERTCRRLDDAAR
jgi:secreted trypsin-like serine protease